MDKYQNPPLADNAAHMDGIDNCPEHGPHADDYCPGCTQRREDRLIDLEEQMEGTGEGGHKAASFDAGGIIYIPDRDVHPDTEGYTAEQLIAICNGNEKQARLLFSVITWTDPHTTLIEIEDDDEELRADGRETETSTYVKREG